MTKPYIQMLPCDGEAHGNAHIDHCSLCAPRWDIVEREMPQPAGLVAQVRAMTSKRTKGYGVLVSVFDAEAQGIDVGNCKYAVLCEMHSSVTGSNSKAYALTYARHPEDWCEECRKKFEGQ